MTKHYSKEVRGCVECPNNHYPPFCTVFGNCKEAERKIETEQIPDWCPLPDSDRIGPKDCPRCDQSTCICEAIK